jgi:hypothetical protein
MPFIPKRPPSLEHLSDEAACRALSRHFGDIVATAKFLGVDRKDLRRLCWHKPKILAPAHERMSLFAFVRRDEIISGLHSRIAAERRRAIDRMGANPALFGHLFASGLSLLAPAARARGPRLLVEDGGKAALEREVAAEQAAEREREAAAASENLRLTGSGSKLWLPAVRRLRLRRRGGRLTFGVRRGDGGFAKAFYEAY